MLVVARTHIPRSVKRGKKTAIRHDLPEKAEDRILEIHTEIQGAEGLPEEALMLLRRAIVVAYAVSRPGRWETAKPGRVQVKLAELTASKRLDLDELPMEEAEKILRKRAEEALARKLAQLKASKAGK